MEDTMQIRIRLIWLGLLVLVCSCITGSGSVQLRIITEDNPPFNFVDEQGGISGQSTVIVRELLNTTGDRGNIEMMSWAEGYSLVQRQKNSILYSTVRLPARENMFKWVGPIGFDDQYFYSRRDRDIRLSSPDDAKKVESIAVYRNDANHIYLQDKGFTNLDVNENDLDCIRKLATGKVDLWLGPAQGLHFIAYEAGVNPAELQPVCYVYRSDYYLAFNRDTDDEVVKRWQTALDKMKENTDSGSMSRYQQIITAYALPGYAASTVTRQQVIELVERTVKDIVADAPTTIARINARSAPYLDNDNPELYVYILDENINVIANASNPKIVGRCFKDVPDMAGRLFRNNIVEGALNNSTGWEDYVFTMPGRIGLYHKSVYYKLAQGSDGKKYIVCAGLYIAAPKK